MRPVTTIPSVSTEPVRIPVRVTENGLPGDPTTATVSAAFLADVDDEPTAGDWVMATWETSGSNGTHYANCLIGPGGTKTLTDGTWHVWIRIQHDTQDIQRPCGTIRIS
jgi:hypothetical protein